MHFWRRLILSPPPHESIWKKSQHIRGSQSGDAGADNVAIRFDVAGWALGYQRRRIDPHGSASEVVAHPVRLLYTRTDLASGEHSAGGARLWLLACGSAFGLALRHRLGPNRRVQDPPAA